MKQTIMEQFSISPQVIALGEMAEEKMKPLLKEQEEINEYNHYKVLHAMQQAGLSDAHLLPTTGYGYNDLGRDTIEEIYATIFSGEAGLCRPQIISGTHALAVALFGNLRPGDEILSPVGAPYDTLQGVIGIRPSKGSLREYGISYHQVELLPDGEFDWDGIANGINSRTKLVTIQRSKGYCWRESFSVKKIGELISFVKRLNPQIICMVDNCYGEFVEEIEPGDVGADLTVGSLIKNPGGGIAPIGGYIVGKKEYVENAAFRLTAPGVGMEAGATLGTNLPFLQGLYFAPHVVKSSIKGAVFASLLFSGVDFPVLPKPEEKRADIVQAISFGSAEKLIAFCQGIQSGSPVDSFVKPEPWAMPGYDCQVIMAAGGFIQGSSIELSADGPLKPPYIAYLQGGLSWPYAKLGILKGVQALHAKGLLPL